MFDFRRDQTPREPTRPSSPDGSARLPSPGGAAPAPPVLTRPRTGLGIPARDLEKEMAMYRGEGAQDSLTMGQLKAHTAEMQPKQKV